MLPATGSGAPTYAAIALGLVALGSMVLFTAKLRRS
jgi:LPXTG-motif cell wall-anchored protein